MIEHIVEVIEVVKVIEVGEVGEVGEVVFVALDSNFVLDFLAGESPRVRTNVYVFVSM